DYGLILVNKLIILSSIFFVPLVYSFILFFIRIFSLVDRNTYSVLDGINMYLFLLVIPIIGMVYGLIKIYRKMIQDKILGIFIASVGPIGIAFSIFLNFVITDSNIKFLVNTLIYGLIISFFYLYKNKSFFEMFKKSYKNYLITLCIILFGCIFYYLFNYVFNIIQDFVNGKSEISNNQSGLNSYLNNPIGITSLFFSSVIFAPLLEEFSYRLVFMNISNNRWYSYLLSIFYFAFLHVQQSADFEHIFTYFSLGIVNGFVFWYLKNLTPCIAIHSITNLIAFVILVTQ
ncbi:MAG: CPBP family intramembrane metalloprotease, partial [Malacoplasma sp.]|nr:CPBP family intramembrane metalloprotease [Malacoplasma sp.]